MCVSAEREVVESPSNRAIVDWSSLSVKPRRKDHLVAAGRDRFDDPVKDFVDIRRLGFSQQFVFVIQDIVSQEAQADTSADGREPML